MQSNRLQPESCVHQQATHPCDQMSTERIIGIVLWVVLFAVLITFGAS